MVQAPAAAIRATPPFQDGRSHAIDLVNVDASRHLVAHSSPCHSSQGHTHPQLGPRKAKPMIVRTIQTTMNTVKAATATLRCRGWDVRGCDRCRAAPPARDDRRRGRARRPPADGSGESSSCRAAKYQGAFSGLGVLVGSAIVAQRGIEEDRDHQHQQQHRRWRPRRGGPGGAATPSPGPVRRAPCGRRPRACPARRRAPARPLDASGVKLVVGVLGLGVISHRARPLSMSSIESLRQRHRWIMSTITMSVGSTATWST